MCCVFFGVLMSVMCDVFDVCGVSDVCDMRDVCFVLGVFEVCVKCM